MARVTAVVLAAGRGERLGGPKALLAWPRASLETPDLAGAPELPLALAHAFARRAAESHRALVVARAEVAAVLLRADAALPEALRPELVVSDADDAQGPAGSIVAAAAVLAVGDIDGDRDVVLLTPVDVPPATRATVAALIERLDHDRALLAARPTLGGRRGHPVALRIAPLLRHYGPRVRRPAGEPPPTLRAVLATLGDAVAGVAVDDPAVLADLDDEASLRAHGLIARFVRA